MKSRSARVIPIRSTTESNAAGAIADLAFDLWVSAAFRGATPEEALVTAKRMLAPKKRPALFLVPRSG